MFLRLTFIFLIAFSGLTFSGVSIAQAEISVGGINPVIPNISNGDTLDFGSLPIYDFLQFNIFVLNSGDEPLVVSSTLNVTGPNADSFEVRMPDGDGEESVTLLPGIGAKTGILIKFDPKDHGDLAAVLSITSNDADQSPFLINLQGHVEVGILEVYGNGVAIPSGDSPPSLANLTDFGSVPVSGGGRKIQGFEATNSGDLTTEVLFVEITGDASSDFSIDEEIDVPPGEFDFFTIEFNPSAAGLRQARVTFALQDSASQATYSFLVQGTGDTSTTRNIEVRSFYTSGPTGPIGNGDMTPRVETDTDFGDLFPGETINKTFALSNIGGGDDLVIDGIEITGPHSSDFDSSFNLNEDPAAVVAAGGRKLASISLNPTATGLRTATISIHSNDPDDNPFVFNVQANALAPTGPPDIDVRGRGTSGVITIESGDTTPSVEDATDFGGVLLGGTTPTEYFYIFNVGGDALNVPPNGITLSGPHAGDFSLGGPYSGTTVPPTKSGRFSLAFTPSGSGLRSATVSIASDDPDENPTVFAIQGTGIPLVTDLVVNSGNNQGTAISEPFSNALVVRANDIGGQPVPGVTVAFSAPEAGASAVLSAVSGVTDANGLVSVQAVANAIVGSYSIVASSDDVDDLTFTLNNEADDDGDGVSNIVDNCPDDANRDQLDTDDDLVGDVCDDDDDNDLVDDDVDNCPLVYNPEQEDSNTNGIGDACETIDNDSLCLPIHTSNNKLAVICL